jgi:hypothetical protein
MDGPEIAGILAEEATLLQSYEGCNNIEPA